MLDSLLMKALLFFVCFSFALNLLEQCFLIEFVLLSKSDEAFFTLKRALAINT